MIRAALALALVALLGGCAGTARYSVRPFYEPHLGRMVCCAATAENGKDIASLQLDLAKAPDGTVTVHFQEAGVGATAPLTAQGAVISNVANAVGKTAEAVVKLTP